VKSLSIIIAAFVLAFGAVASRAANVDRISAATGVPIATLQAERASTGLGWGSYNVVALHRSGQGWGKIAHDNGLNLGRLVSNAHSSSNATVNAKNTRTMHGKAGTHVAKGHSAKRSTTRGIGHRSSGFSRSHGMRSMGHMSGFNGMRSMGHGGGHGR
jgi:hypothetical protein